MDQQLLLNRYRLQSRRGRGGFAVVDVAWDQRLRRRVAIKRIPLRVEADELPGIEEARTAAMLSDAHIVSVYDFELTGTEALIIMENVDGPSLAELMQKSRDLFDLDTVAAIVSGVATALECAHENQVLHLDIKPGNILIDHTGQVKVSDFGLAALSGTIGFSEPQGGTIGYMPPEQIAMEPVDERSDLWALAALTYQLLTGDNPFFADSSDASLSRIVDEPLLLPSVLRPELDEGINDVLVHALDADKDTRPQTISAFWKSLAVFLGREKAGRQHLKKSVEQWAAGAEVSSVASQQGVSGQGAPISVSMDATAGSADVQTKQSSPLSSCAKPSPDTARHKYDETRSERVKQGSSPLWQRMSPRSRGVLVRLLAGIGCANMAWLGSGGAVTLSTSFEFSFTVRAIIALAILSLGFFAPSLGVLVASVILGVGIILAGQPLLGAIVLAGLIVWWILCGRRSSVDATILACAPLAAALGLPFLITLSTGFFLKIKRSFALSLTTALLLIFLTALAPTDYSGIWQNNYYGSELLICGFELTIWPAESNIFFILSDVLTRLEIVIILAAWLLAALVLSTLGGRRSQVLWSLGILLATLILAIGVLAMPLTTGTILDLWSLFERVIGLIVSFVLMLIMIAMGIEARPSTERTS